LEYLESEKKMEKMTDWIKLWRELVERQHRFWNRGKKTKKEDDTWKDKAKGFDAKVKERWIRPDPHRDFIVSRLSSFPGATVLDIGAGTGSWAILMSRAARKVTAIEPSAGMRKVFRENLEKEGIENVEILEGRWPEIDVKPHDFSLSSHSVYGNADLPGFVQAMSEATGHTCFMLLRAPDWNGLMAQAAIRLWGQPNDSPNFRVAYNAMLQMGMYPNVLMEGEGLWPPWTNDTFDEALEEIRSRFGVTEGTKQDAYLEGLLRERLRKKDGFYVWPVELRTALVYWDV
jgi:SAM-dependent methyltransferase